MHMSPSCLHFIKELHVDLKYVIFLCPSAIKIDGMSCSPGILQASFQNCQCPLK